MIITYKLFYKRFFGYLYVETTSRFLVYSILEIGSAKIPGNFNLYIRLFFAFPSFIKPT
jgi:hypothetical protein